MNSHHEVTRRLRDIEIFTGLADEDYEWLRAAAQVCHLRDGDVLIQDGAEATHFYVVLRGELIVTKVLYQHEQFLTRFESPPPERAADGKPPSANVFIGELPLLTGEPSFATIRVCGHATVARYTKDAFFEILARFPSVLRAMLPALIWRMKAAEAHARNQGITAALSTLAAGLAHEIDNPAAAIMRAASVLDDAIESLVASALAWGALAGPAELAAVSDTAAAVSSRDRALTAPAAFGAAADALSDWARARGAADPDGLADVLAGRGVTQQWLAGRLAPVRESVTAAALDHLGARLEASEPLEDIRTTIPRITKLVADACEYASLGRAPLRAFSVTEGLEATLAMLRGKLAGVRVVRAYQPGLPTLLGYPSELNQVWTQLLDNALEAMNGAGTISIGVSRKAESVLVEITDTGHGIPAESMDQIFHPFYTTKDVGKGTGLGLYLAHQIVAQRHGGSMTAHSVPGETILSVRLPIAPPRDGDRLAAE